MAVFNNINIFHKTKIQIVILKYSRKQEQLVARPKIFRLFVKRNLMLMYCDLWPKDSKIE